MKIIGISRRDSRGDNLGFIVELDHRELQRIAGIALRQAWNTPGGSSLDVCQAWDDAMACRAACDAAAKLPATLRATADCMEAVSERVRAIADAVRAEPAAEPVP